MPTKLLPTASTLASGWPSTMLETWSDAGEVPHPAGLFAEKASTSSPIAWSAVEELDAFVSYVMGRDRLVARIAPTAESIGFPRRDDNHEALGFTAEEVVERFTRNNAVFMITGILGRARATGVSSPGEVAELTELYEAYERAWLAPTLPAEYVVPLVLTAFGEDVAADGPVPMSTTVRLERLDVPARQAAALVQQYSTSVSQHVLSAATHAIVVTGQDEANPGPGTLDVVRPVYPAATIETACQALQVVARNRVGYASVLRRPIGWTRGWTSDLPPLEQVVALRQYWAPLDDGGWNRRPGRLIAAGDVMRASDVLRALETSNGRVRIAASRLSLAFLRTTEQDSVIDACVGLEALLGDGRNELTHRMSLRAAAALASRHDNPLDPERIYKLASKVYSYRSSIVHGSTDISDRHRRVEVSDGTTTRTVDAATELLRALVLYAVEQSEDWTPTLLDQVVFARLRASPGDPRDQ